jgi:aspartate carbamoyltransferase
VLKKQDLRVLFSLADELRKTQDCTQILRGKTLGLFFLEASTRTRISFESAMKRLGGETIYISSSESSMLKGETFEDSVRCISATTDAIVIRHPDCDSASKACSALELITKNVRIINGGDGTNEHPTQTLADLYTIRSELGTLGGLRVVIVGDLLNGRTVHSLVKALSLREDIVIDYVAPNELQLPQKIWDYAEQRGVEQKCHSELTEDIIAAADVVYMTRLQTERLSDDLRERFSDDSQGLVVSSGYGPKYCITPSMLAKAKNSMRVLHPLPRGPEISTEIDSDPRAAYFRQAQNAVFIRMALLVSMLG